MPVFAEVEVLAIVADAHKQLAGGIVLMEFEEQARGVKGSGCAIEGSHRIAFIFLSDALGRSKVQLREQRPSVAGMTCDRC